MSAIKPPPYVLLQLPDITESINYPIRNVRRVKYTCFDVSKSLIAFGAISGGIYVFNRSPCEFIQLIPNKDGPITRLAISANEKHIGFANGRGIVTVTSCDQSLSGGHSVVTSKDHQGNEVTAIVWSENNMLFSGDDIGKVSVLQLQNFIAKTFQNSSQIIMSLDSRICQIDTRSCMLLVSTLTRCYVCDTSQEQYRQIGQKLRDGEFGACFVNTQQNTEGNTTNKMRSENDILEFRKYNMVNDDLKFAVRKELENTLIFCARPSSRLWESTVDGTVKRTHQFKQVLARNSMKIITKENFENEEFLLEDLNADNEGKSINFSKIYSMNSAIFCFRKDALYFLDIFDVENTVWYEYKDIVDCKIYHDMLYVWLNNGCLLNYRYMKIDKFILMCYVEEKYTLCAKMCAFYNEFLMSNDLSPKLHILAALKDKVEDESILFAISNVLDKFESLKSKATQIKSGIYFVDNTYNAQTSLDDDFNKNDEYKFAIPETMQTLKGLSVSMSDKLTTSKKILKEKWEGFEDKMKNMGEKSLQDIPRDVRYFNDEVIEHIPVPVDNNIIYKESSQTAIENDNNIIITEQDKVSKSLYQYFRLSLVGNTENSNLISLIESDACDIRQIYNLMLKLEEYCVNISAAEESKFIPNNLFLSYLNISEKRDDYLESIIKDEELYKYFVDSCIIVNMKTQKLSNIGCECGFPLPYARTNQTPIFSELIDKFIEMQWSSQSQNQCYDICKRMPYLWRKILYLRRNEDLMNVLRILLQILDENLLHSFLPQFTLNIWNKAVQLYATLYANICLNCSRKFDNISVRDMLCWDDLGALMIKSIGGKNSIKVMENYANLIDAGAITVKFYHTCLLVTMFEAYDATVTAQLTDTLYCAYDFNEAKIEICNLLRNNMNGVLKNTALPIVVAANSTNWGLTPKTEEISISTDTDEKSSKIIYQSLQEITQNLYEINNKVTDCALCGLPLQNEVLIKDGGLWVFKCGHTFHGACLNLNKVKLCPI